MLMKKHIIMVIVLISLLQSFTACGKSKEVLAVESAISEIGIVTLDSADSIKTAQEMVERLSESERQSVSNYQELMNAIETLSQLEEAHYQECYDLAVSKMLDNLVIAEELCNLTLDVWHNAIWQVDSNATNPYTKDENGVFFDDFNDALNSLCNSSEYQSKVKEIYSNDYELKKLLDIIKLPPEKFKGNMQDAFVNYYAEYQSFIELALYYNESYNSFSEKFDQIDQASVAAYRKAAFYISTN